MESLVLVSDDQRKHYRWSHRNAYSLDMQIINHWIFKRDKLLHMLAGIFMVDMFVPTCALFLETWLSITIAFVLATLIMAAKEIIYDKFMNRGVCSVKDFIAGEIGILI